MDELGQDRLPAGRSTSEHTGDATDLENLVARETATDDPVSQPKPANGSDFFSRLNPGRDRDQWEAARAAEAAEEKVAEEKAAAARHELELAEVDNHTWPAEQDPPWDGKVHQEDPSDSSDGPQELSGLAKRLKGE